MPDELYSVSDIQDYFECNFKNNGENIDKPLVQMYIDRTKNRITVEIKDISTLELSTKETIKLLGSTESKITKDKNGENLSTSWN